MNANDLPTRVAYSDIADVYRLLETRPEGLTEAEAADRLRRTGPNTIQEIRQQSLLLKLLANFTHLMALLLWAGGIMAFVARMPELGVAIWSVNLINGAFSFWQEFKAERATAALRRLLPSYARVVRDGEERRIQSEELVPGDVMLLAEGDHVCADGRLLQEAELRVDQSTLSGESLPVSKTALAQTANGLARVELPNLVFAGTSVAAGTGRAVVMTTGMQTEFGTIAHLTQSVGSSLSPLQLEIAVVTRVVTAVAVSIGLLCLALALTMAHMRPAEGFIFALGMIVAFVPEGLLPTVTLALAMGVQRMVHRHALVKRLSAVETLGCTSVICTDKTGTLTQNEMTVRELWAADRSFTVSGTGYDPAGEIVAAGGLPIEAPDGDLVELLRGAELCNNARLLPPNGESSRWTVLGDPTEAALCVAARKGRIDPAELDHDAPRVHELPFDSRRKRMTTIHQIETSRVAYVKGAPREMLDLCTRIQIDGEERLLSAELRERILAANDGYARGGLRVLAVARRVLPPALLMVTPEAVECELTLLGLLAMMDPPRPEVATAVEKCHRAGIRIVMITGDYGLTAESIARRIGIVTTEQPQIITGVALEKMDDEQLKRALQDEVIFARVAPEHKLRVTQALQQLGHVVAMTGDGVNDAPALKQADIGVAMGIGGSDVAKEAADMILTDDNFASIVNAIEEGRTVYANIKKFTTYIFTSNAPEAVPFMLFAFSGGRIPLALTVMQILSIDLGTDLMPALALGTELPEPGVMERPPRRRQDHIITWPLLARAYLWLGLLQSLAAMAAFFLMYWTHGYWGQWLGLPDSGALYQAATAMTLAAVVATQIGNLFAQRTHSASVFRIGLFSNRLVWVGIATEVLVLLAIIYVPLLQTIFGTAAIPPSSWVFLLAVAPFLFVADELRKALLRRSRRVASERAPATYVRGTV